MLLPLIAVVLAQATPTPRHVVRDGEAPRYSILGHKSSAALFFNATNGSKSVALSKLHLGCGAEVPEHTHASDELLYFEDGAVEMTINGEVVRAQKGDAVFIPAGTRHSAKVVPLRPGAQDDGCGAELVQIYSPAGPEQRFAAGKKAESDHPGR